MRVCSSRWTIVGAIGALSFFLAASWAIELQAADYRLCAFRQGPDGPCSCHNKGDQPGNYTIVDEDNCGRRPDDDYYEDDSAAYVAPSYAPKGPVPAPRRSPRTQVADGNDGSGSEDAADTTVAVADSVDKDVASSVDKDKETTAGQAEDSKPSIDGNTLANAKSELASEEKTSASEEAALASEPETTSEQTAAAEPSKLTTGTIPVAAKPKKSTLLQIQARGKLNCGVNTELLGFSAVNGVGEWQGIDADFCRAVAIAVLGSPDKVTFVPLHAEERFLALQQGRIDLLSRNTTWTMSRVVDFDVEFVGVSYFDGQGFLTRHDRGLVSAQQLEGLKVCVQSGTTSEANLDFYLKNLDIDAEKIVFPHKAELLAAYEAGACDAYTADRSALLSERAGLKEPDTHEMLPETISKEPLGPVVRQDDREWIEIVRWTLAGLINAEEVRLTRERAGGDEGLEGNMKRLVDGAGQSGKKLGLTDDWLRKVVSGVGNYGEVFEANIGKSSPLGMERGMNALWKRGGLLYAPPMW